MQMPTPAASVWSAAQEKLQAKEAHYDNLYQIQLRPRSFTASQGGREGETGGVGRKPMSRPSAHYTRHVTNTTTLAQCNLIDQQCCSVHILDINIQVIPGRLKAHEGLHYYEPSPTLQTHVRAASGMNIFCFCLYPAKKDILLGVVRSLPLV